jgi:hypothetical protein
MPKTANLREESRLCREGAQEVSDPHVKQIWARRALTSARLAEKGEREDKEPGAA